MITKTIYLALDRSLATIRFTLLAGMIGMIVAGGYFITAYSGSSKANGGSMSNSEVGSEGVRGRIKLFKMSEKTAGEDRWNLTADTVIMKENVKEMTEVHMHYLPAMKQGLGLDLSSRTAVVKNATSDVAFSGEVKVKTSGQMPATLHSETLNWSQKNRQISTGGAVRVESRKAVITGQGLVVDLNRQTLTVLNAVQAAF